LEENEDESSDDPADAGESDADDLENNSEESTDEADSSSTDALDNGSSDNNIYNSNDNEDFDYNSDNDFGTSNQSQQQLQQDLYNLQHKSDNEDIDDFLYDSYEEPDDSADNEPLDQNGHSIDSSESSNPINSGFLTWLENIKAKVEMKKKEFEIVSVVTNVQS